MYTYEKLYSDSSPAAAAKAKGIKFKELLRFLGPAFVVSVAYIDPGNFATNISGGSKYGYTLLWVVFCSNIFAIFLQTMSAKLGIATGKSLAQLCGEVYSRKANRAFFVIAEFGAMATDLAEFLGGTLGFYLLFRMPMPFCAVITALVTFFICYMEKYGQKIIEVIISVLVSVICAAYLFEVFIAKPDFSQAALHTVLPILPDGEAVLIAVGMLGATVMPHVIYLHSQLVQYRCSKDQTDECKRNHLKMEKIDIIIAMNVAFVVNAAMVLVSAAVFFKNGLAVTTIEQAKRSLEPLAGALSGGAFGIALLASGLSSAAVGTMAGQNILDGFVNLRIPVNVRRLLTMLPAVIIIALGVNPMKALLLSQVCLSFILPFPIIQMLYIAGRKDLLGAFANTKAVSLAGWGIAALIIALNILLLLLVFSGRA